MGNIEQTVSAFHASHLDNGRLVYYATKAGESTIKPLMPATPFIFEYFLFNSIYQHDWEATHRRKSPVQHDRRSGMREWEQQKILLDYLQSACSRKPNLIERAFRPFKYLVDLDGAWTAITSNHDATIAEGEKFFQSIREIQGILKAGVPSQRIGDFFSQLDYCRDFVCRVRNNIFHGVKSLNQTREIGQSRRLEVYHLVIQSINSLFFLVHGKSSVASDEAFIPMEIQTGERSVIVSSMQTLELFVQKLIKREDSELVAWASERLRPMWTQEQPDGVLFYPSAGCDIITPLLIGLPFCKEFHFYDRSDLNYGKALKQLERVLGYPKGLKMPQRPSPTFEIEFDYAGVKRRIVRAKSENEEFLTSNSRLMFFFHRGDSEGEGGAGQPLDGEWFARWKEMIPTGRPCAVLTDATSYGLHQDLARHLTKHESLVSTRHQKPYYCGIIQP